MSLKIIFEDFLFLNTRSFPFEGKYGIQVDPLSKPLPSRWHSLSPFPFYDGINLWIFLSMCVDTKIRTSNLPLWCTLYLLYLMDVMLYLSTGDVNVRARNTIAKAVSFSVVSYFNLYSLLSKTICRLV